MKPRTVQEVLRSKPTRRDARHEAAHAVAAVRVGLPLASTDIRRGRPIEERQRLRDADGAVSVSVGYTTLTVGTMQPWVDALPDAEARDNIECYAIQVAAGIGAELDRGGHISDPKHGDDFQQLVQIAAILKIPPLDGDGVAEWIPAEDDVAAFIRKAINDAQEVLMADDGTAWEHVTTELLKKHHLSGDQVRKIIADCDAKRGKK